MRPVDKYVDKVGKSLWLVRFYLGISCGLSKVKYLKRFNYQAKYWVNTVGENYLETNIPSCLSVKCLRILSPNSPPVN